jgi:hypothetical protein
MHLVDHVFLAHLGQVLVCPCVTRYLMAVGMHSANQCWIAGLLDVHLAFSKVVSGDEKSCLCIVASKDVQKMPGEVVRTVIECQCDMVAGNTLGYPNAFIGDVAN